MRATVTTPSYSTFSAIHASGCSALTYQHARPHQDEGERRLGERCPRPGSQHAVFEPGHQHAGGSELSPGDSSWCLPGTLVQSFDPWRGWARRSHAQRTIEDRTKGVKSSRMPDGALFYLPHAFPLYFVSRRGTFSGTLATSAPVACTRWHMGRNSDSSCTFTAPRTC